MNIQVGDIAVMKKKHPCGNDKFLVLRVGMDFRLKCIECEHTFLLPRSKAEKSIKSVISSED